MNTEREQLYITAHASSEQYLLGSFLCTTLWFTKDDDKNLLEELYSVCLLHRPPQIVEAAMVIESLTQYGEQTGEHRADLEDIGPHSRLHAALGHNDNTPPGQTVGVKQVDLVGHFQHKWETYLG